jgi:adenosylhomocysteinase
MRRWTGRRGADRRSDLCRLGSGLQPRGYVLPKHLDEKVSRLHLDALGVRLPELAKAHADYLGVDVAGTYKANQYRY